MSNIPAIVILLYTLHFTDTFAAQQNNTEGTLVAILTFTEQPPSIADLQSYTKYILDNGWEVENVELMPGHTTNTLVTPKLALYKNSRMERTT